MITLKKYIPAVLVSLFVLVVVSASVPLASASESIFGKECGLRVLPYAPNGRIPTQDEIPPLVTNLDNQCEERVPYGRAYQPQPPHEDANPLQAGTENIKIPVADHAHAYFNASDRRNPDNLFFYKSFVKKFEVTLHSDGFDSINFANLRCELLNLPSDYNGNQEDLFDCNGTDNALYGGTTITKREDRANRKVVFTWTFATNNLSSLPFKFGDNGARFGLYNENNRLVQTIDLTNINSPARKFDTRVWLESKNNPQQIWSATTSARILMADLAMRQRNYPDNYNLGCVNNDVNDRDSGWCYLNPARQYARERVTTGSGPHDEYYWFPLTREGTVWRKPPQETRLTLVKEVVNDDGGTARPRDFELFATKVGAPNNGQEFELTTGVPREMPEGTYQLREVNRPGYLPSEWGGDCTPQGRVTLRPGDNKSCSITNNDIPEEEQQLTIVKRVINDDGGNARPIDFELFASTVGGPNNGPDAGEFRLTTGVPREIPAGTYQLREVGRPGYLPSVWGGDCTPEGRVTLRPGDNKSCSITNNDIPEEEQHLTIVKTVINDDGGDARPIDFELFASTVGGPNNGPDAGEFRLTSGVPREIPAGTYQLREVGRPGYLPTVWGGDCTPQGRVTLRPGDNKSCSITNNDIPDDDEETHLTIHKRVINRFGGRATRGDFVLTVRNMSPIAVFPAVEVASGERREYSPGNYLADEVNLPGYRRGEWSGDCDPLTGRVTLNAGDDKVCTITNYDTPGRLRLVKTVINDDGGRKKVSDFPLFINGRDAVSGTFYDLAAGRYIATETNVAGYEATVWGGDCTPTVDGIIILNAGDEKTCTITNNDIPRERSRLTLVKRVINDDGGTLGVANFPLYYKPLVGDEVRAVSGRPNTVSPGKYVLREDAQPGYTASGWVCDGATLAANNTVNVALGDNMTCVIINDDIPSPPPPPTTRLTLVKTVIVNGVSAPELIGNFPLYYTNASGVKRQALSGVTVAVDPGTYSLSEDTRPGFNVSAWDCSPDVDAGGTVTLALGQSKTCRITNQAQSFMPPPPPPQNVCTALQVVPNTFGLGENCFEVFTSPIALAAQGITWTLKQDGVPLENRTGGRQCFNIKPGTSISVEGVPALPGTCRADLRLENRIIEVVPPRGTLTKTAFESSTRGNVIIMQEGKDIAEFAVTFHAITPVPSVTVFDLMPGNKLTGSLGGTIRLLDNEFSIVGRAGAVPACRDVEKDEDDRPIGTCFTGNPFSQNGITFINVAAGDDMTIRYKGKLTKSAVTPETCSRPDLERCGEIFINTARDSLNNIPVSRELYTPCPYLLTHGVGDVILESDLSVGTDISTCAGRPNIEGQVIVPEKIIRTPGVVKTGGDDPARVPTHSICKRTSEGAILPNGLTTNPLKSVSSSICELSQEFNEDLESDTIKLAIEENVIRFTRANENLIGGSDFPITGAGINDPQPRIITDNQGRTNNVFKVKKGNDLIVGTPEFDTVVAAGARTYVVENGDLIINGNITFDSTQNGAGSSFNSLPSIAFIVVNGSIRIAPTVTNLSGVFVALKGADAGSGLIASANDAGSVRQLVIDGSIVGDIDPLFKSRSFVGNAAQGQGTIVINYGAWLYYNLPPILKDIMDIQEEQVAR